VETVRNGTPQPATAASAASRKIAAVTILHDIKDHWFEPRSRHKLS
jgi:hypothetical protein